MTAEKVIWITGASSGIGEALALACAKEKASLILSARRLEELERVKKNCLQFSEHVTVLPLDLSMPDTLKDISEKAIAVFGKIDMLINSGGISQRDNALQTSTEVEQRIMKVNFFSTVALTKNVLPQMIKNGTGNIVIISSVTGKFGVPQRSAYAASKHALIGYFDSLRAELTKAGHSGIHITIAVPGYIKTAISYHAVLGDGKEQGVLDKGQAGGMSAAVCAEKILRAVKKNKREILIGNKEIFMVYIRRFFPALYYRLITKVQTK